MRKTCCIGVTILILLLITFSIFFYPNSTLVTLERALQSTGIDEGETVSSGQFVLNHLRYTPREMDRELSRIASVLSIGKINKRIYSNPFGTTGEITGLIANGSKVTLRLDCCQYNVGQKTRVTTKARFELSSLRLEQGDKAFLHKIKKMAKGNGEDLLIPTCILGTIHGKLNEGQRQSLSKKIFQAVNGCSKEQFSYGQMSTYQGYTPWIFQSLFTKGEKTNFQLAIRYNEAKNCTIILLGSPIIDIEY